MKFASLLLCVMLFLPAYARALESNSYFGISLGSLDSASISRASEVLGAFDERHFSRCLSDGSKYAIFHLENNRHSSLIFLHSVTLSMLKPAMACTQAGKELPSFAGLTPGMFSFEIIARLNKQSFETSASVKGVATLRKDNFEPSRCYHRKATDYVSEHYYYGAKKTTYRYTLSDVKQSVANTLTKSVSKGFLDERNDACDAKNYDVRKSY